MKNTCPIDILLAPKRKSVISYIESCIHVHNTFLACPIWKTVSSFAWIWLLLAPGNQTSAYKYSRCPAVIPSSSLCSGVGGFLVEVTFWGVLGSFLVGPVVPGLFLSWLAWPRFMAREAQLSSRKSKWWRLVIVWAWGWKHNNTFLHKVYFDVQSGAQF